MSKSPSLRRIQADVRELAMDPSDRYHAAPLENDMFEWHFTIRGAEGTDFEGGVYHGRILLPPEYPFKPPHIMFLTPSGRFETNTKICLSFSAFHPELWQPAWGIRLILEALIAFLPSPADGAIGSLDWTSEERKRLAKKSVEFTCHRCGKVVDLLPKTKKERPVGASRFQKEIEQLRLAQLANEGQNTASKSSGDDAEKTDEAEPTGAVAAAPKDDAPINEEPSGSDDTATEQETQTPAAPELVPEDTDTKQPAVETTMERSGVPHPTPVETTTPEQVLPAEATEGLEIPVWFTDPILNIMIILIAMIMFLLIHKARVMLSEIAELNDEYFQLEQQLIQQQQQQS